MPLGEIEHVLDLGVADDALARLGVEQAGHGFLHLVDELVDDGEELDLHALALGGGGGGALDLDVEADDDGIRRAGEQDVRLRDGADGGMDDIEIDFLALDLAEGVKQRFHGALDIGLDDELEERVLALGERVEDVLERGTLRGGKLLLALGFEALLGENLRFALALHDEEFIAGVGEAGEAEDLDRSGRRGLLDLLALVVDEGLYLAAVISADEGLADLEGAHADDDGGGGAAAGLDLRLDDGAARGGGGTGLELEDLGLEEDHLEEVIDPGALERGDGTHDDIAAPVLRDEALLLKLAFDLVDIGAGQIDFVDGDDDGDLRGAGVGQGLKRLRHGAVIGGDDEDDDVRDIGAAGAHGGECLVAGGVEESDLLAVVIRPGKRRCAG